MKKSKNPSPILKPIATRTSERPYCVYWSKNIARLQNAAQSTFYRSSRCSDQKTVLGFVRIWMVTIKFFWFYHNSSFFSLVAILVWSLVTRWVLSCVTVCVLRLSQFELSHVLFEFLGFWTLSQFELLSVLPICSFVLSHNLSFWVF